MAWLSKNPSGLTRSQEQIQATLASDRAWTALKRHVELRDGDRCRLCRRRCKFDHALLTQRADPHHIIFRSAGGEHTPENILKLCRSDHDDVHVHRHVVLSGNAELRDNEGRLCGVKVERLTESGWQVERWI